MDRTGRRRALLPRNSRDVSRASVGWLAVLAVLAGSLALAPSAAAQQKVAPAPQLPPAAAPANPLDYGRSKAGAIESLALFQAAHREAMQPPERPKLVDEARTKRLEREMVTPRYQRAQTTFIDQCSSCHGPHGGGDGPWHTLFHPYPANLTLVRDAPDMMRSIIIKGIAGTMMPAHPDMSPQAIDDVIYFVTLQPTDVSAQWAYPWELQAEIDKVTADEGRPAFVTTCQGCHGPEGHGDGIIAKDEYVWPKPADFRGRSSDPGRLFYIVTYGRPGTMMGGEMPPLTPRVRWALAKYVETLFQADGKSTIEAPKAKIPERKNPYSRDDLQVSTVGGERANLWCAPCHGENVKGTFQAPRLIDRAWFFGGGTDTNLFTIVTQGIPGKLMPGFKQLSEDDRWRMITFIRHMGGLPLPGMRELEAGQPTTNRR